MEDQDGRKDQDGREDGLTLAEKIRRANPTWMVRADPRIDGSDVPDSWRAIPAALECRVCGELASVNRILMLPNNRWRQEWRDVPLCASCDEKRTTRANWPWLDARCRDCSTPIQPGDMRWDVPRNERLCKMCAARWQSDQGLEERLERGRARQLEQVTLNYLEGAREVPLAGMEQYRDGTFKARWAKPAPLAQPPRRAIRLDEEE